MLQVFADPGLDHAEVRQDVDDAAEGDVPKVAQDADRGQQREDQHDAEHGVDLVDDEEQLPDKPLLLCSHAGTDVDPPFRETVRQFEQGVGEAEETTGQGVVPDRVFMAAIHVGQVRKTGHLQKRTQDHLGDHRPQRHAGKARAGLVVAEDAASVTPVAPSVDRSFELAVERRLDEQHVEHAAEDDGTHAEDHAADQFDNVTHNNTPSSGKNENPHTRTAAAPRSLVRRTAS